MSDVTQILSAVRADDNAAAERLFELLQGAGVGLGGKGTTLRPDCDWRLRASAKSALRSKFQRAASSCRAFRTSTTNSSFSMVSASHQFLWHANHRCREANAALAYREHRYPEALVLLDRDLDTSSSRPGRQSKSDPAHQASCLFLRALLGAELGRAEEARRDFAGARAQLNLALGDKPGHDRGDIDDAVATYEAESRQREAEALFQPRGIAPPEPDVK